MKIIGSILIFLSSLLCTYYYEKSLKTKISHLEDIIAFISYAKSKIEYFSLPINQIYEKYESKSKLINNLINSKSAEGADFDKESKKIVSEFFGALGNGFKKEQIALCEYTNDVLSSNLAKSKEEYPKKIKIFRSLALFTGISLIILLV